MSSCSHLSFFQKGKDNDFQGKSHHFYIQFIIFTFNSHLLKFPTLIIKPPSMLSSSCCVFTQTHLNLEKTFFFIYIFAIEQHHFKTRPGIHSKQNKHSGRTLFNRKLSCNIIQCKIVDRLSGYSLGHAARHLSSAYRRDLAQYRFLSQRFSAQSSSELNIENPFFQ